MNRAITLIIATIFILSGRVYACQELNWDESKWAKNSNSVYVVRVVGVSAPELLEASYSSDVVREALVTSRMDKEVSFVVYETLKGEPKERSIVLLNWCRGGEVKLGYVGVLYGLHKDWHLKLGINAITATKNALTNVSN